MTADPTTDPAADVRPRILIVDDDPSILEALVERFEARGFDVATATTGTEALVGLRRRPDIVLLDLQLPEMDGIEVLRAAAGAGVDPASLTVIMITAHGSIESAVAAMKAGAYDFLPKPFEPALVEETVRRALERSRLVRMNAALRAEVGALGRHEFLVTDARMEALAATAEKAAASGATVLLLGESGTGKEVLARRIHDWSPRAGGPFVAVNCVALTESILESELFGHEEGAFTGATARRTGTIELAHGGTLFLDEIGDIAPSFQAKLLRVLQERTFERVGGTDTIEVDLRVVAATNKDLKALVDAGTFREDLYYRLNVIHLTLPPLRERPGDVLPLARHFVERMSAETKRPGIALSEAALEALAAHRWPGNVRELRNALERAVVLCEGDTIEPEDLPPEVLGGLASGASRGAAPTDGEGDDEQGYHAKIETFRRQVLSDALAAEEGNRTRAAERLGLQRTYLARLIKQHGLAEEFPTR